MSKDSFYFPTWPLSLLVLVQGGEIYSTYPFFIIGVLHIIVSGILGLGGIYHFIFGPERLEETSLGTPFAFSWQDRDKVSTVLGAHLIILGLGSILLYIKGVFLEDSMTHCHKVKETFRL